MNEKLVLDAIRKAGGGKSYYPPRVVGNRIEVHFCGDYEKTILEIEPKGRGKFLNNRDLRPKVGRAGELGKQKVDYLRKMASQVGIPTKGLKKSDLIAAIVFELQGQSSNPAELEELSSAKKG